ncbi:MAG: FHA domain-containing protein [Myxococcales bacterium]|nr:FHA domain-containing protein [Myxococcales bacterium]
MIACTHCGAVCRRVAETCQRCGQRLPPITHPPPGTRTAPDTIVDVKPLDPVALGAASVAATAVADGAQSQQLALALTLGRALVQLYAFDSPIITVGRGHDNDIVIDDESISREHCRIRREEDGRYAVHDLGTANGTTVNGRATVLQKLVAHDEIGIGRFVLLVSPSPEQIARYDYSVTPEGGGRADIATTYLDGETIDSVRRESAEERSAHLRLVGSRTGKRFALAPDETVIGRSLDADVPLLASLTAERHAVILRRGDGFLLMHVGGMRAVYLNGRKIKEAALSHRDQIRIGTHIFQFFQPL